MLSGKEIREYRERWGLSINKVANYCDVTPQYIGNVELEKEYPNEKTYKKIMDAINKANYEKQKSDKAKDATAKETVSDEPKIDETVEVKKNESLENLKSDENKDLRKNKK